MSKSKSAREKIIKILITSLIYGKKLEKKVYSKDNSIINEQLLWEKWVSILFHVQKKHSWTDDMIFHDYCHPKLG